MSDPRAMYEQVILDHNKNPRNFGPMPDADTVVDGYNPLCGDTIKLYLKFDGDTIAAASFDGQGCAIAKASASLSTNEQNTLLLVLLVFLLGLVVRYAG